MWRCCLTQSDQITKALWYVFVFCFVQEKTCDQNHVSSIRNLIICDISGSNSSRESTFSIGFLIFGGGFVKSQLEARGTKILHYTWFDIWYLIPIWYQNLMLMDQMWINIKFDVWYIKFGSKFDFDLNWYQTPGLIINLIIKFDHQISVFDINFDQIWSSYLIFDGSKYLIHQNLIPGLIWSINFDRGGIKDTPSCQ